MINVGHFRELVIRPVLHGIGRYSEAAENLLVGIALHESKLEYLTQLSGGPARGVYQMEESTHADLWNSWLRYRSSQGARLWVWATRRDSAGLPMPDHAELVGNLYYATAAAREQLYRAKPPLPEPDDDVGLANYWEDHWCKGCVGTTRQWLRTYRKYS